MSRKIIIKTYKEAEVSVEEIYKLEQVAFQQWTDAGLYTPVSNTSVERLQRYIADKAVFVAQDEATGELLAEAQRLRKAGYRYMVGNTGIPAIWSVKWHLKNGYHIVGYSRSERNNYASYIFRKQIATDLRHHPADLLWTKPIAPVTAKLLYCLSWLATNICKSKSGKLNWIGRMAKRSLK